jgi:Na+-transporting NADH:ubiquinone oxidoreductase subunit C
VGRWRDRPSDDPVRAIVVAAAVCLACSLVVSTAAVLLRPRQLANRERERGAKILALLGDVPGMEDLLASIDLRDLDARVVDLETGDFAAGIDPATYDQRAAAADPARSTALPEGRDPAGLGRRERFATVYLVRRHGEIALVVLPVRGNGFQSMLYGYVALDGRADRIEALTFYEHGETPGLGAEVASPEWLAQWHGVRVRDESGRIRVHVAEGEAETEYEVDGISGATWTGKGVTSLLRFWLGPDGFGPFLTHLANEEGGRS